MGTAVSSQDSSDSVNDLMPVNPQAMTYLPLEVDPAQAGKSVWQRLHLAVPNIIPEGVNAVSNALLAPGGTLTGKTPLGNALSCGS